MNYRSAGFRDSGGRDSGGRDFGSRDFGSRDSGSRDFGSRGQGNYGGGNRRFEGNNSRNNFRGASSSFRPQQSQGRDNIGFGHSTREVINKSVQEANILLNPSWSVGDDSVDEVSRTDGKSPFIATDDTTSAEVAPEREVHETAGGAQPFGSNWLKNVGDMSRIDDTTEIQKCPFPNEECGHKPNFNEDFSCTAGRPVEPRDALAAEKNSTNEEGSRPTPRRRNIQPTSELFDLNGSSLNEQKNMRPSRTFNSNNTNVCVPSERAFILSDVNEGVDSANKMRSLQSHEISESVKIADRKISAAGDGDNALHVESLNKIIPLLTKRYNDIGINEGSEVPQSSMRNECFQKIPRSDICEIASIHKRIFDACSDLNTILQRLYQC